MPDDLGTTLEENAHVSLSDLATKCNKYTNVDASLGEMQARFSIYNAGITDNDL